MSEHMPAGLGNMRWSICALLFAATTINYMDRQVLGLLAPVLQKEIGWSEIGYANVVTAFQVGYALGLVGFGRLIDVFGTKHGYALAISVWSLAAMGHALVHTVTGFGVARFALGIGEAGNFPAAIKTVAEWFPKRERALATGIFNSGSNVGAVLGPLTVPWLTVAYGWPASFLVMGALGFVWLLWWLPFYTAPERMRNLLAAELIHIQSDVDEAPQGKVGWLTLLGYRQTWAYVVGMSLTAPVWWFYLYWLPKFYSQHFSLDLVHLGTPLIIVYTMTIVGSIGGGWLSSALLRRGWSVNAARKTALIICACAVMPVIFAPVISNIWAATGLIGMAAAGHQGWAANLFTLVSDLFPKQVVASVVGLGAMFGSITAILFAQMTGLILQATGSYWSLFAICAGAYPVALFLMHVLAPRLQPIHSNRNPSL